ncbi:unnamed protein product [Caretta caretta]
MFEMGHGSRETGITNDACTRKNDVVEKQVARSLGQDLSETLDPGQGNANDSNKGLYGTRHSSCMMVLQRTWRFWTPTAPKG